MKPTEQAKIEAELLAARDRQATSAAGAKSRRQMSCAALEAPLSLSWRCGAPVLKEPKFNRITGPDAWDLAPEFALNH